MEPDTASAAYRNQGTQQLFQRWIIATSQLSIYPTLLLLRLFFVRKRFVYDNAIKEAKKPLVIYANHQSQLDAFIICASLPFKMVIRVLPFRFFVKNNYFKYPLVSFLLKIFGGFPAHDHLELPYGLNYAKQLLSLNQSIVIFPQGKRTREDIVKSGVSVLAAEPNVRLMPIQVNWLSRWRCELYIGKPFKGDATQTPKHLMEVVYSLPMNHSQEV